MEELKELVQKIKFAADKYYSGNEIMNDTEFDNLVNELRKKDPKNRYFSTVGSIVKDNKQKKITHEIPMLSMAKLKGNNFQDITKWCKNVLEILKLKRTTWLIEPKLDGNSLDIYYDNGHAVLASTRGNGKIGLEIPLTRLNNIPLIMHSNFTGHIRGEAIIKKVWKKNGKIANDVPLRNFCAGLLHRNEDDKETRTYVSFIAYQIEPFNKFRTDFEMLSKLRQMGFDTVKKYEFDEISKIEVFYNKYINTLRDSLPYETDGLVLIYPVNKGKLILDSTKVLNHHHHYNVAIKPGSEAAWTKLIEVEWQVGRTGKIIPVGIIETIPIGDATYNRVTLNSKKFIDDNKINLHDEVLVRRSNDVIPQLMERKATENSEPILLLNCPSCNTKVELDKHGTYYICPNKQCPAQILNQWLNWFKCTGVENISDAGVAKLLNGSKFIYLHQLYYLTNSIALNVFWNLLGNMDTPTMRKFMSTFENSRYITEKQMIAYYGIPGIGMGTLERLKINKLSDLEKYKKYNDKYSESEKSLCRWLNEDNNLESLKLLRDALKQTLIKETSSTEPKVKFCITGEFNEKRTEIIKKLEKVCNWQYSPTVTKDLNVLLASKNDKISTKIKIAEKLGIVIYYIEGDIDYNTLNKSVKVS